MNNMTLEEYLDSHCDSEPTVLKELSRVTHLKTLRPRMMSGNIQGQFLKMLCRLTNAENVLEIGTFTGYAALSMAMGISDGGRVHTIDVNDEVEDIVKTFISKSQLEDKILFYIGDALTVIPQIDCLFDIVFIDADKRDYIKYYDAVFDKIKSGGLILADDVLWDGKVCDDSANDPQTKGIKDFNSMIMADDRVEKLILPLRHGLFMIRKK